jgi:hypothetical protein
MNIDAFNDLLTSAVITRAWMVNGIYASRAKDYTSAFRKMPYESQEEMDAVVGKLEDNSFIKQQMEELQKYKEAVASVKKQMAKIRQKDPTVKRSVKIA